ncbi:Translin [Phlyctochytrium arcticum]|nr:Translin [Phlyctochytrium arcticum]
MGDSVLINTFRACASALDEVHDRRERIVKISRDITICSKRWIFLLHRDDSDPEEALRESEKKKDEIVSLLHKASKDLRGNNWWRLHRSIAPGLEEYIEAASFSFYLQHKRLMGKEELQQLLQTKEGEELLTPLDEDYVLGLADLTGEVMRYAINSLIRKDTAAAEKSCLFLREIANQFEICDFPFTRGKMPAMRSSLKKVENACYTRKVRGAEHPDLDFSEIGE